MECTDVSADIHTEGTILTGQVNESIFEVCDTSGTFEVDTDWHEVTLDYGRTYLFFMAHAGSAPTIQPELTFFDRMGSEMTAFDSQGQLHFRYTARYTGRHYVSAFQGSLLDKTMYTISAVEIRDDTRSSGPRIVLSDGYGKLDEIEISGDTDTFDLEVFAGRTYNLIAVGQNGGYTLADPSLELARNGTPLASGPGFIRFDATARETLQLTVGGNGGTGTYEVVGLVTDDAGQDAATAVPLAFDANRLARQSGYISAAADFDWYAVSLQAGDVVQVSLSAAGIDYLPTPSLIVRDTALNVIHGAGVREPSDDARLQHYFKAPVTGTYFMVARTKRDAWNGGYEISVEKVRTPAEARYLFGRGMTPRLLVDHEARIPLADLLDLQGLDPFAYQVHASFPLYRDGNTMAANQTYGIIAGNIGLWSVDAGLLDDPGDLLMRAVVSGDWSPWQKFPVTPAGVPAGLLSDRTWNGPGPVTYRFVTSLPDHYTPGEFGDFVAINEFVGLGEAITDVFGEFNRIAERDIVAAEPGETADIDIFAVTGLGQAFLSYLPDPGRGGDLIFNQADFPAGEMDELRQFRLLRAIGTSLGLKFTEQSRLESVMGSQLHPKSLVPANFGWADWLALQAAYGTDLRDPQDEFAEFSNFVLSGGPALSTIGFEGRNVIVGEDVSSHDFTIDLRDGGRSFARNSGALTSEVVVAYGAQAFSAVGGDGNDFLFGNGLENVLQGGEGDDFLTAGEQDDIMIGGLGNDTMIHNFGDGHDLVSDIGGQDTLCFIGRGPFEVDDLFEDYLFTRDGEFLNISLTLDGGLPEGSVRIDTGFNNNNLIERLELWHEGQLRQRISLFSLWNELSEGQTSRFVLANGSDSFGRLVSPA
jgi:Ca2+-binding RTX toxin-like protein